MEKNLTLEQLDAYEKSFDAGRANQVAMRAVTTNGVVKAATNGAVYRRDRHQFPSPWNRETSPTRSRAAAAGCSPP